LGKSTRTVALSRAQTNYTLVSYGAAVEVAPNFFGSGAMRKTRNLPRLVVRAWPRPRAWRGRGEIGADSSGQEEQKDNSTSRSQKKIYPLAKLINQGVATKVAPYFLCAGFIVNSADLNLANEHVR
jgi:hypothetical protein